MLKISKQLIAAAAIATAVLGSISQASAKGGVFHLYSNYQSESQ
jgi:hypothetical protein